MREKRKKRRVIRAMTWIFAVLLFFVLGAINVSANGDEGETMPPEYDDFLGALDGSVTDKLPDSIFSNNPSEIEKSAGEMIKPENIISMLFDLFFESLKKVLPILAILIGIVILSALANILSSSCGALSRAVDSCTRLCTFCAISGLAVSCVKSLSQYFDRLFASVSSFLPLSAALYAMGGNLNAAAGSSASLTVILSICEFFFTKTVIPIFCICLCLSLLSAFDGVGASAGGSISAAIRKWYMIALSFLMAIMTFALGASNLLSVKADNLAMKGMKFAVSSFIPISGGTLSSTLGNLAASVELLRGSIGVIGIVTLLLMLLPTVVELALLRGVFAISGFCASMLGCPGEARLLSDLESLYGYLEGVAALSAAVFIFGFAIFAKTATPFS